jgi:putative membrane protein
MGRWLLIRWVSNAVALFVAAWLLEGVDYGDQWWTLLIAAAVFTVVNFAVKPILTVLSIPFIVVTLGLFYFLLNVLMLWWGALAAIIVSVVNGVMHRLLPEDEVRSRRR